MKFSCSDHLHHRRVPCFGLAPRHPFAAALGAVSARPYRAPAVGIHASGGSNDILNKPLIKYHMRIK
jgi:hypothetical protein